MVLYPDRWRWRWSACAVALVHAACSARPSVPTAPVLPPVSTAPAATEAVSAAAAPPLPPGPPPERGADFTSFEELKAAMKGAIGKTARLRLYRDHYTSGTEFTAETCEGRGSMRIRYTREQRDHVRAMYKTPKDECAFVTFRVTGVDDRIAFFEGTAIEIWGITPRAAVAPAAGADFAFIDDVLLAGPDARGKIVDGVFYAYDGDPKMLWVSDCHRTDAMVFVPVRTAGDRASTARLPRDPRKCGRAHLRIVDPSFSVGASDGSMQRPRAEVISVP